MRKRIQLFRVIEAIFLVGFTIQLVRREDSVFASFNIFHFDLNLNITYNSDPAVISTMIIGYAAALIAGYLQKDTKSEALWLTSISVAFAGALSFLNEALRYIWGYDFQIMLNIPPILLLIDWALYRSFLKEESRALAVQRNS